MSTDDESKTIIASILKNHIRDVTEDMKKKVKDYMKEDNNIDILVFDCYVIIFCSKSKCVNL